MTRGEAREQLLAAASELGLRHGTTGVRSLRLDHTSEYITRVVAGRAGMGSISMRGIDAHTVASTYAAAYAAAAQR